MDSSNFMPHGHCYLWRMDILLLHSISDAVIFLSYLTIPILLAYIVYKCDYKLPFNNLMILFSIFILACGTTHFMEIVNIWKSEYVVSGIIKAITAVASILTAISLLPYIPKVIKLIKELDIEPK